ncbi:MAG: cytochrome c-type biogenesis protein CcmH [Pseudomonadales bacterium]|jgi:cytochrome c-type biogenesis protein CcmH|nr:cytochrome c-type biogenesis protein CcmH [Pseudomonadales bacterium]
MILARPGRWIVGRLILALLALSSASACFAVSQIDTFEFSDEVQERRYRALIDEFRCPKCLNTNLAGSDAPIAQDLRKVVYRLVVIEAKADQEVRDYLQVRYGDFVLYDPPFNARTWYIWVVPIGLGLLGVFVILGLQRRVTGQRTVLDSSQQARLRSIVQGTAAADADGTAGAKNPETKS